MSNGEIVLLGCGDVGPLHEPVDAFGALVRPVFATADLRFAQCERMCTDKGALMPHGSPTGRIKPHMDSLYEYCGFNVVSVAGNHAMDWGGEALLDAMVRLQKKGIYVMGGGRNIEEARKPAIVEKDGVKVAFLAYCSILHPDWEAGPDKPGIAPMRVHTYYEPIEKLSFLPVQIDKELRPEVLLRNDPRFGETVKFMEWVSEGFDHKFTAEGNEVIVTA